MSRLPGFLLINPRSGRGGPGAEELRAAAVGADVEPHVLGRGEDAADVARAAETDALGVAGGDGSLGAVAAVAIERDLPFVCVPFGTRNHFARDIGLDRNDPFAALEAFADGVERRIDVGVVDETVFLNNVSLGLYARLVHRRERHRRRREALARVRALLLVAKQRRRVGLVLDGQPLAARVVVVANNEYRFDPWSLGARDRLDEGLLYVYTAHGLLRSSWDERSGERFTIDAATEKVAAALDGEPVQLSLPARFELRPLALRLRVPRAESD